MVEQASRVSCQLYQSMITPVDEISCRSGRPFPDRPSMPSSTIVAISLGWIMSTVTSQIMNSMASKAKCQYFDKILNILMIIHLVYIIRQKKHGVSGPERSTNPLDNN